MASGRSLAAGNPRGYADHKSLITGRCGLNVMRCALPKGTIFTSPRPSTADEVVKRWRRIPNGPAQRSATVTSAAVNVNLLRSGRRPPVPMNAAAVTRKMLVVRFVPQLGWRAISSSPACNRRRASTDRLFDRLTGHLPVKRKTPWVAQSSQRDARKAGRQQMNGRMFNGVILTSILD